MTQREKIVTIGGNQRLTYTEVRKLIHGYITATHYAQAAEISMQLADQLPQDPWPHLVAAESLYLHQQIEPALRYIERALEIDPRNIAALVIKSRICLYSGKNSEAKQLIDTAIGLTPNNAQLHFEKGELLSESGDLEGSRTALLAAINLDPRNTGSLLSLSRLPGDNISDTLIDNIESLIQSHQLPARDQVNAHFALANAYDRKGHPDRHFSHLTAGNALINRSLKYDPSASRQEAHDIIEIFSKSFFAERNNVPGNPAKIIFIVGFPRCGSTLVEQILSSHPSVSSAGEIFALNHAIRHVQESRQYPGRYPLWINNAPDEVLMEISDDYLRRVEKFDHQPFLTDKLLNNYIHVGLIHLIFPNARIINVQRNPIDVCYSCYKHLFHLSSVPYTYSLEYLASKYRDYRKIIRHWDTVLPGKIHTVEYEHLVVNQQDVTRDLLKHCGLSWNDACMDFHKNKRAVLTSSSLQVRQSLYTDSINRWKRYAEYLGPLLELTNE